MRRLILSGTRVVGRHLLDAALAGGHQVTRFNRGQSLAGGAAVLPAGVTWLQGDRDADVSALASPAGAGGALPADLQRVGLCQSGPGQP